MTLLAETIGSLVYFHISGTKYGKGVYFATGATVSHSFAKETNGQRHMYLCRVLTGSFTQGATEMFVPPYKDEMSKIRFDSVVNRLDNPSTFVVFQDAMAYPEYLITYLANRTEKRPVSRKDVKNGNLKSP